MSKSDASQTVVERWTTALRRGLPQLLSEHKALRSWSTQAAALLHGSTTRGLDDPWSDLDLWLLLPDEAIQALQQDKSTSFFEFQFQGKPGHFTVESPGDLRRRIGRCDFPLIAELRTAQVLTDHTGQAAQVVASACRPMPETVRRAWAQFHYVEMRSEHRAADSPIERGDALALLQATVAALRHAMQAAMIWDHQPYPYVKWLAQAASRTPTGQRVIDKAHDLLDLLANGALAAPGPEKKHPISLKLREIRAVLVESMRQDGLDAPWLDKWYLHLPESKAAIKQSCWMSET